MPYNLKGIRILIIDGNVPIRTLLRSLLMDLGFRTVDVEDGSEKGWLSFCNNKPDIILVDWRMDSQDSIEFVERVRKDPSSINPYVPIMIMTGFTQKARVLMARDAGVTEFLIKPFSVKILTDRLTYIIEKPRDFVMAPKFIGPDRRRRNNEAVDTDRRKRTTDV
jgi:DNA-binding response OmpR family regulator